MVSGKLKFLILPQERSSTDRHRVNQGKYCLENTITIFIFPFPSHVASILQSLDAGFGVSSTVVPRTNENNCISNFQQVDSQYTGSLHELKSMQKSQSK